MRLRGWLIDGASSAVETNSRKMGSSTSVPLGMCTHAPSRVQCTEGIAADIKVASEVLFNRSGIAGNLLGETADLHPIRQFAQQRQLPRKAPVHEHQLRGNAHNPVR